MIALVLGAGLSLPPSGSYTYAVFVDVSKIAQTSVTIVHDASGTTVSEEAVFRGQRVVTRALFDDDGHERSDDIVANGAPIASISLSARQVTIRAQGTTIPIETAKSSFTVVDSGLGGGVALLPALIAQTHATTFTRIPTSRPRAVLVSVGPAPAHAVRPSGVAATDAALSLSAEGLTQTMWFDPKTYVLDALEGPVSYYRTVTAAPSSISPLPTVPPTPTPPPSTFPSREVNFRSQDGSVIAGTLSYPIGDSSPFPAVVLVAGSGTHDRDERIGPNRPFRDIADGLNAAGYAVLRYDKRFAGTSSSMTSPDRISRQNYVDDVIAATKAAASDRRIDHSRIALLGHSEGGELIIAAALQGAPVVGLALFAPLPIPYAAILKDQRDRGAVSESELRVMLKMHFLQSWHGVDPRAEIRNIRVPLFIAHGSKDANVTDAELSQLINAAKKSRRRLTTIELDGDNHLFAHLASDKKSDGTEFMTAIPIDPRVITALVRWLHSIPRN